MSGVRSSYDEKTALSAGKVSRARPSAAAHAIKPGAPVGGKGILRKVTLFGGGGDPLKKRILIHGRATLPLFFLLGPFARIDLLSLFLISTGLGQKR
jgi:hypothetical protein